MTCVIFLAAIDEYDTYLITEDNERANRLQESIEIFRQIQLQNWLQHTTFILFLNKKDVFEEKIRNHHLIEHFSDFPGHNLGLLINMDIIYWGSGWINRHIFAEGFRREAGPALEFIKKRFHSTQPQQRHRRMIYTHHTTATGQQRPPCGQCGALTICLQTRRTWGSCSRPSETPSCRSIWNTTTSCDMGPSAIYLNFNSNDAQNRDLNKESSIVS